MKNSSSGIIAFVHFLNSLVIVIGVGIILLSVVFPLVFSGSDSPIITFVSSIITLMTYWFGAKFAANRINKKYFINNKSKIIILSTLYLAVLMGTGSILGAIHANQVGVQVGITQYIFLVLNIILFYAAGNKYIKNSQPVINSN